MTPLSLLLRWFGRLDNPWPHARPLPPHVQAVKLNPRLLWLHMKRAAEPPPPPPRAQ